MPQMDTISSFGEWVRKQRRRLDLTQAALATRTGCALVTIKKIEQEVRRPSREMAELLATHLAIPESQRHAFVAMARGEYIADIPASSTPLTSALSSGPETAGLFPAREIGTDLRHDRPDFLREDWGDAPVRTSWGHGFHGRRRELAQLGKWLREDGCNLIGILGMGGVGKTALATHLAREVGSHFERVFWRSLLNAPPLDDLLPTWLHFLSRHTLAHLPNSLDERLSLLLEHLRRQRCLLVLDNCEAILQTGDQAGHYRPGYEAYGRLLHWMVAQEHNSCLLLTSRERPRGLARLEQESQFVHSYELAGLAPEAGRNLLLQQGVRAAAHLGDELVACYSGNPLALKLVADTIRELFGGDVSAFLGQETPLFDDIRDVLDQQFSRLSLLQRDLVIWLAVEREPLSLPALETNLVQPALRGAAMAAVRALQRRTLLERVNADGQDVRFTLQNVVMEYATERLIATVCEEILEEQPDWLNRYALLKAEAKEYVRQSQARLFIQPLARRLLSSLGRIGLEQKLKRILAQLREDAPLAPGYAAGNILNLLLHLGYNLAGYDFSRLAVWQTYLRGTAMQDVDFSHADFSGGVFTEMFGPVHSVALSPDGQYLAAALLNGEICLWHAATGWSSLTSDLVFARNTHTFFSVCFSPDSRTLASASLDRTVQLWDVKTGECLHTLRGHASAIRSVVFSPDGHTLASGSEDRSIRLWNVPTGELICILRGHMNVVRSICFSPDGHTLASASDDRTVRLWEVAGITKTVVPADYTGEYMYILRGHTDAVFSVAFGADGRTLASGSLDRTARVWDLKTGECLHILQGHTDAVFSVAFSADGRALASGSGDQTVRLWDVKAAQCTKVLHGHSTWVSSLAISADGRTLASGSGDQSVRLWDMQSGQSIHVLQGNSLWVRSVCFSADGRTLASGGDDQFVHLWDVQTGTCLHRFQGHTRAIWSVSLSPDGRTLASSSVDRTVRLWDIETGECLHILEGHASLILSVAFSPDGRTLASGGEDQTVRLWDVARILQPDSHPTQTETCLHVLQGHTNWLMSVCFSPDGCILASGGGDQTVRLWDVHTGQSLQTLPGHSTWIKSVCFSADGQTLASVGLDARLRLWDVQTGQSLYTLQGHSTSLKSICLSADGRILAGGTDDQSVRLWDVQTRECLQILQGHSAVVKSLCFSNDGRILASGSEDQSVRLWDVQTGECLHMLRSDRPYERMNITGATGLTAGQTATLQALGAVTITQPRKT